jgi:hypothetical protein
VLLTDVNFSNNAVALSVDASPPGTVEQSPAGAGLGGALFVSVLASASVSFVDVQLALGAAVGGAGMFAYGNVSLSFLRGRMSNNSASGDGGALLLHASPDGAFAPSLAMSGVAASGNLAARGAVAALSRGVRVNASSCLFTENGQLNSTLGAVFAILLAGVSENAPPPSLSLASLNASGNAAFAGGFVYTDSLKPVLLPTCAGCVLQNTAVNGAYSASPPASFNATAVSLAVQSGAPLPPFSLSMFDAFGQ